MIRLRLLTVLTPALALAACGGSNETSPDGPHRVYGAAQPIGNGTVRTYLLIDDKNPTTPIEVGVAMSETSMQ